MAFRGREIDTRIIILGIIILLLIIILLFVIFTKKELKLISPKGGEKIEAGKTLPITWKSRKIGKVDIYLISEGKGERMMIAEGVSGKKFDWKISFWQKPADDYKIEIIEHTDNIEKFYDQSQIFRILGPTLALCEQLSIPREWPFIPSDYPDLKRVFITRNLYNGNLGGLSGADQICQREADALGLEGKFQALLGDENISAKERLNLDGIFVAAGTDQIPGESSPFILYWKDFQNFLSKTQIEEGKKEDYLKAYKFLDKPFSYYLQKIGQKKEKKFCYRLLGKNFDSFFQKIVNHPKEYSRLFFGESFEKDLEKGIWIGRLFPETRKECVQIPSGQNEVKFSFTTSCQNWTTNQKEVGSAIYKECYDNEGKKWRVNSFGGISILPGDRNFFINFGAPCDSSFPLICIEQ
jgi:hypothetical protein